MNKLVMGEIKKIAGKDPAMMQWLSAAVGAVVGELTSSKAESGAAVSSSATKNNDTLEAEMEAQKNGTAEEVIKAQNNIDINESDISSAVQLIRDNNGNISYVSQDIGNLTEQLGQSTIINAAISISDSVLEPGMGIKSPTGKFNVVIAIYDDSKEYSGTDFGIAVASDVTGYLAGNIAAGAIGGAAATEINNNPVLVVYGTYIGVNTFGGIFGDSFSKVLKENFAKTDTQKGAK